ncbi:DeoR/GlpR family DNA-binding transcription regulator [Ruania halotolerans]|uniref:DeoR/GlpR family DNA-binding transcription regulator n=1 Tax=Ruania halotolerans TaxID=2897773 RepID=UPI001E55913C|nr:DeoR/GlpR family DNA-binding transcription regulator [Ruania halotolerans]UFU07974.1 DeoR/GlpR family DNA-binding transcription regulator [Ruania halotolerans]
MLRTTRRASIIAALQTSGEVSVQDLADEFGVSLSTIRRDLNELGQEGLLQRVRGGGSVDPDPAPFHQIAPTHAKEKDRLGRRAAELVRDGDVIICDIGTTVAQVARHLRGRRVTVITASLAVIDALRDSPETELIVLGGVLRPSYLSLVGALTESALSQITADIAFLGASGVRSDGSLLDSTGIEVPVKRAILRAAERSVLVVADDKFPGTGLLAVCGPDSIGTVVTSRHDSNEALDALRRAGSEVLVG